MWAAEEKQRTVGIIDADGQYDPSDLRNLFGRLDASGCDLVVGNRFHHGRPHFMTTGRAFSNRIFSRTFAALAGLPASIDAQSGLRAMHTSVALSTLAENAYTYTQEQLLRARLMGLRVESIPAAFYRREHGASRLVDSSLSYARRTVPPLLTLAWRHFRRPVPVPETNLFGPCGPSQLVPEISQLATGASSSNPDLGLRLELDRLKAAFGGR
jgi:hypothetical protein